MSPGAPSTPPPEDLQFHTAEYVAPQEPQCLNCKSPITPTYYVLGEHRLCETCGLGFQSFMDKPPRKHFWKAVLFGIGASVGGAILLIIVAAVSGFQIGLLSILVGWMVGRAMKHATLGRGSRALQIAAVIIAYFGITASYSPGIVKAVMESAKKKEAKKNAKPNSEKTGVAGAVVALSLFGALLIAISAIAPFLELTSGISGILGIIIVGVGLRQAWRMMAPLALPLVGPLSPEPAIASPDGVTP